MTEKDEIAIVGVGCRFPGANNLDEYWRVLKNGENHVVKVPPERWNADAFYDSDPNAPGKTYAQTAGFIDSINEWDHRLYGINDMEAELIDPQQRLVLDCVHMALEDAGITRKDIDGTSTGVYIGSMTDDYKDQVMDDTTVNSTYSVTGTHPSIISARVSYIYNLTGPAITLDTACSSSLVAIDIASQAILSDRCDIALCGGVNVLMEPQIFMALSKARMLSPTGQCKTFTAMADGYARGEGCGIVVLKSLKKAQAEGNKIWGTIKTGTNQDGHMATPITAPSGLQQQKLIEQIYRRYGVNQSKIQVIEAHGTGTPIGDPTETHALGSQFGTRSNAPSQVYIGSVKTNIGHLEAAAGVAGLIKVLLMMKHGTVVPSLWYSKDNENPKLKLSELGFIVPTSCVKWKKYGDENRLACVNSFGFGGTNAHAIVKEYIEDPRLRPKLTKLPNTLPFVVTISALDHKSLIQNVSFFYESLNSQKYDLASLSCTSTCKRDHRSYRTAVFGLTHDEIKAACQRYVKLDSNQSFPPKEENRIIFVFCGVGTAWNGMCRELLKVSHFCKILNEIDEHLKPLAGWSITAKFKEETDFVADPMLAHIAIFACQVGLAALWDHFGVKPDAVIGQSVGEVAAAHAAGYIDMKTAVCIIFHRSQVLAKVTEGTMAVVRSVETTLVESYCKTNGTVNIAVYNSPSSCTVSGKAEDIEKLKAELRQKENNVPDFISLDLKCAYHSPYVAEAAKNVASKLKNLAGKTGTIPMFSTVTGQEERNGIFGTPSYWEKNVAMPVKFSSAIKLSFEETKHNIFIEIGPNPVLRAHVSNILKETNNYSVVPTMRKQNETNTIMEAVCSLYSLGVDLDWKALLPCQGEVTDIPRYQFRKYQQLYLNPSAVMRNQGLEIPNREHMFIQQIFVKDGNGSFKVQIDENITPFVFEHIVSGFIIVPGATYADIGFQIAQFVMNKPPEEVSVSLEFLRPVKVDKGTKTVLNVTNIDQFNEILFHVKQNQVTMCKGWVQTASQKQMREERVDIERLKLSVSLNGCIHMRKDEMYKLITSMGFKHGACFQMMNYCVTNGSESLTRIEVPDMVMSDINSTTIHPCILDVMFQSTMNTTSPELVNIIKEEKLNLMPVAIEKLNIVRRPEKIMYIFTRRIKTTLLETVLQLHYNALLVNADGTVIADLQNYTTYGKRSNCNAPCELNYQLTWHPVESSKRSSERNPEILVMTNSIDQSVEFESLNVENIQLFRKDSSTESYAFVESAFLSFSSKFDSLQEIDAVLFIVSNYNASSKIADCEATEVHTFVKENCMLLTDLFRYKSNKGIHAPLYIATQNTLPMFRMEGSSINIVGHEVWGFVRSVHMEFIHGEITLIDLQPSFQETKSNLVQYIAETCRHIEKTKPEIVIRYNDIFGAQFTKVPKRKIIPAVRAETKAAGHTGESHRILALRSSGVDSVFLGELSQKNLKSKKENSKFIVKSVCLHPLFVFPRTTSGINHDQDIWKEEWNEGHALFGLEFTGYLVAAQGSGKPSCRFPNVPFDDENLANRWEMVAIFPTEIFTELAVPKECTVSLKEIPFYKPGLLLFALLSWRLIDFIPKRASVVIFSRNPSASSYKIVRAMIVDRRNAYIVEDTNEYTDQAVDILITLETLEPSFPLIGMCRTILCLEECLGESVRLKVTRSGTQKIESLNTKQILERKYVGKKLSSIVSWLQKRYHDVTLDSEPCSSQHCNDTEWSIPCQSVTVLGERGLLLPVCSPLNRLFNRSNVYIVTGGLTGLGWEITRLLAEMGAGIIVSLSRRGVSVEKAGEIEIEENKSGCKIVCVQCDVTSLNSVQTSMKEIQQKTMGSAIKGVFHGAGILNGHMLMNLDEESLEKVLKPKVIGTLNMHIATQDMNLDFFVVQSSINAIIGSPGQNSYGAANAFLDTFMEWRRRNGLPGQAINWGALAVGMAARPEFVVNFEKRGFNLLSVSEIRTCFQEALLQNSTGVIYANINWDTCAKDYISPNQVRARLQMNVLFEEVTSTFKGFGNDDGINISFDIEALVAADEEGQRYAIRQMLNIVAKRVIGGVVGEIVHTSTLTELSFDSMSTVTFINIVQDITTYKIPLAFMGDTSHTLEDVENLLFDNIFKVASNEITDEERPVSSPDKKKVFEIEYPDKMTPVQT